MSPTLLAAMIGALVPLTGLLTWLFDRRHKTKTAEQDSTSTAITAIADASHTVVDVMTDLLQPLQDRLDLQQESIDANNNRIANQEKHIQKLEMRMHLVVGYTKRLRIQIESIGHEPIDLPAELEDLYKE